MSAKVFGGKPEDYSKYHNWMDSTKAASPAVWHRAILHNSFGIFLGEQLFGETFINSDGKEVSVRDVLEQHVIDDHGFIPNVDQWFEGVKPKKWMMGEGQTNRMKKLGFTEQELSD